MLPSDSRSLKRLAAISVAIALVFLGKDFLAQVLQVISTVSSYMTPAA